MTFAIDIDALRERAALRARLAASPANRLTNDVGQFARLADRHVSQLIDGTAPEHTSLMTAGQAAACHAPGWTDAEMLAFIARRDRLIRWGRSDREAEDIAERLTLRDRDGDNRRMCVECRHGAAQRCPDGAPLPVTILHRCPRYSEPAP